MKIKTTNENIIFLQADTQYELTSSFWRLQEYYESPKFRGKLFGDEEYMDWYAEEYGNFTYFTDWNGFNVPGETVSEFYAEKHPRILWNKEKRMRDLLKPYTESKDPFYVIGVYKDDDTVDHEFSHAFFHLDKEYRKEQIALVNNMPKAFQHYCCEVLKKKGYHPSVFVDETVAYLATNNMDWTNWMFGKKKIPWEDVLRIHTKFQRRYEKYKKDLQSKK